MASIAAALSNSFSGFKLSSSGSSSAVIVNARRNSHTGATPAPTGSPSEEEETFTVAETAPPTTDAYDHVASHLDEFYDQVGRISRSIHASPEIAHKEYRTMDTLARFMEQQPQPWKVIRGAYNLGTCVEAVLENRRGGRSLMFICEMDAVPEEGHANGHNLSAACSVALGAALGRILIDHDCGGRLCVLACPASGMVGKSHLLRFNAFKGYDAVFSLIAGSFDGLVNQLASVQCEVEYTGVTTHSAAPWNGQNSLDAAVLAYMNITTLRHQLPPHVRIAGLLGPACDWRHRSTAPEAVSSTSIGTPPKSSSPIARSPSASATTATSPAVANLYLAGTIPSKAQLLYSLRCDTISSMQPLQKRINNCFEAAALATGTECSKVSWNSVTFDLRLNASLSVDYMRTMRSFNIPQTRNVHNPTQSTDLGNVSYEVPTLAPVVDICGGEVVLQHTKAFAKVCRTEAALEKCYRATKGLAYVATRMLLDSSFCHEVKNACVCFCNALAMLMGTPDTSLTKGDDFKRAGDKEHWGLFGCREACHGGLYSVHGSQRGLRQLPHC